jgi:hypothetical protein
MMPLRRAPARAAAASVAAACAGLAAGPAQASVNSYRFLHVTIDTPWHIFLFLLMGVFAPFILMVVLMWRNSARKRGLALDKANAMPASGADAPQASAAPPVAAPPPQPPHA